MSESRACAHPGCAGSARKGSDYCCNAHKQAAYRKRNAQPVTDSSVTVTAEQARNICEIGSSLIERNSCATPDKPHAQIDSQFSTTGRGAGEAQPMVEHTPQEIIEIDEHGVVTSSADPPTSQCYRDSGIPLPGDPGYKGVCRQVDGPWQLDPNRKRMSREDQRTRYARQGM